MGCKAAGTVRVADVMKNCHGAVTLFLLIIFIAMLVLTGVLVDAARIRMAEERVGSALASAARSALAGCHEGLASEYGVYGSLVKAEDIEEYLKRNLKEQAGGLNLVRYKVVSVQTAAGAGDGLENNKTLQEQILQYAKYRAPLSATAALLENLAGCGLEEKTGFAEVGRQAVAARARLKTECAAINKKKEEIAGLLGTSLKEKPGGLTPQASLALAEMGEMIGSRLMPLIEEYEGRFTAYGQQGGGPQEQAKRETALLRQKAGALRRQISNTAAVLEGVGGGQAAFCGENSRTASALNECLIAWEEMEDLSLAGLEVRPRLQESGAEVGRVLDYIKKRLPLKRLPETGGAVNQGREFAGGTAGVDMRSGLLTDDKQPAIRVIDDDLAAAESERVFGYLSWLGRETAMLAQQGRDNLFLTWYVMDKFTYLTSATVRDHYFQKGEVEYIIGGDDSETANLVAVFQKIFFLRYAVNVLQCFMESKLPELSLRLASALAGGVSPACRDVIRLYRGEEVPFLPIWSGLKMKYSDYLRLFLLLESENSRLERIKRLMEVNMIKMRREEGFMLASYRAACRVAAEVEINLWFLPALPLERFRNGKYNLRCEAFAGY